MPARVRFAYPEICRGLISASRWVRSAGHSPYAARRPERTHLLAALACRNLREPGRRYADAFPWIEFLPVAARRTFLDEFTHVVAASA
jgi:hypothetical protein